MATVTQAIYLVSIKSIHDSPSVRPLGLGKQTRQGPYCCLHFLMVPPLAPCHSLQEAQLSAPLRNPPPPQAADLERFVCSALFHICCFDALILNHRRIFSSLSVERTGCCPVSCIMSKRTEGNQARLFILRPATDQSFTRQVGRTRAQLSAGPPGMYETQVLPPGVVLQK